ncbi:uncharacterized protein LOC106082082 [Stomoxys calcitrans]|uniref:uncharacterized protein LOC106082082 n=1 Tax=Stomoxys calcitrans TaxID=35570 RepID=UPI0027E22456|nr:uncharacterized protein LOC106082082 [Stomoxys calcitrans]
MMWLMAYDYMEEFLQILKIYVAFVHFIELACPSRLRWAREEFNQNERDIKSIYNQLLDIVKQRNNREFRKFTRINISTYEHLVQLLKKKLQKYSARKPIPPECRLLLTLMYLAYDSPRPLLQMAFRLGSTTLRSIITDTCECIANELASGYYLTSLRSEDYYELTEQNLEATGMPNCIGSLDAIQFLTERKTRDPIVVVASCNTKYQLINVDVNMLGEVMKNDNIINNLLHNRVDSLPDDIQMADSGLLIPSYFVTPRIFPFVRHTMRPYPGKVLTPCKEAFNARLKTCSDYLDNSFGILIYKWKVLQNRFAGLPEISCNIIKSCIILHNFAIEHDRSYLHNQLMDHVDETTQELKLGVWREAVKLPKTRLFSNYENTANNDAFASRDLLKDYLFKEST